MLRQRTNLIVKTHKGLDIALTMAAFIGAYFIKRLALPEPLHGLSTNPNYYIVLLLAIIIWYLTLDACGLYSSYRNKPISVVLWEMLKAVSIAMFIMAFCLFIFKMYDVSRLMMGIFFLLNVGLLAISKGLAFMVVKRYRSKGFNYKNVLIVGSRGGAKDVIDSIVKKAEIGYKVIGCIEIAPDDVGRLVKSGVRVIGTINQIEQILTEQVVDELIFSMPLRDIENIENCIALAEQIGVSVRILPQWWIRKNGYNPTIGKLRIETFSGIPTLSITMTPVFKSSYLIKRILDYFAAAIGMILCIPLFILIAIAIKLISRGPVLFTQERCGMNGRIFKVYKFRTMATNAEEKQEEIVHMNEADGPVFKIQDDPRIVPYVGKFIRKTGLDELPQLINVLKGEMSMVGPRPPIPHEVEKYEFWQRRRLSMKPGLTCLWQISPERNDVSFKEWMELDLKYIDTWSLGLDFKILLQTAVVVFTGSGR